KQVGFRAIDLLQSDKEMRGVRVADDQDRGFPRIGDRVAVVTFKESRGAFALLVERIGRFVALIEAAGERLVVRAVGGIVENAIDERGKAGRKALGVIGRLSNEPSQREQARKDQRGQERAPAKRN